MADYIERNKLSPTKSLCDYVHYETDAMRLECKNDIIESMDEFIILIKRTIQKYNITSKTLLYLSYILELKLHSLTLLQNTYVTSKCIEEIIIPFNFLASNNFVTTLYRYHAKMILENSKTLYFMSLERVTTLQQGHRRYIEFMPVSSSLDTMKHTILNFDALPEKMFMFMDVDEIIDIPSEANAYFYEFIEFTKSNNISKYKLFKIEVTSILFYTINYQDTSNTHYTELLASLFCNNSFIKKAIYDHDYTEYLYIYKLSLFDIDDISVYENDIILKTHHDKKSQINRLANDSELIALFDVQPTIIKKNVKHKKKILKKQKRKFVVPLLHPVEELVAELVTPVEELVAELVTPVEELVAELVTPVEELVAELVANPVEELVAELVTPVEELVAELVANPVEELVANPVEELVANPVENTFDNFEILFNKSIYFQNEELLKKMIINYYIINNKFQQFLKDYTTILIIKDLHYSTFIKKHVHFNLKLYNNKTRTSSSILHANIVNNSILELTQIATI